MSDIPVDLIRMDYCKVPLCEYFYAEKLLYNALNDKPFVVQIPYTVEMHVGLTFARTNGHTNYLCWWPVSHVEVEYFFIQFCKLWWLCPSFLRHKASCSLIYLASRAQLR